MDTDSGHSSLSDSEAEQPRLENNLSDNNNSCSSLSDMSTCSSMSSISSRGSDADSESSGTGSSDTIDSEDEEEILHLKRYLAIQKHIAFLQNTRVLRPNKVHKLSQLALVLVAFKADDPERFRRNLRVCPNTFDSLLAKINNHPIFFPDGPNPQLPVENQLAIALFRFGHFGNSASVESVAQWAGCSAGSVVNATRRVMQAFLSMHDEVIHYPSDVEKEAAKEWVEENSCAAWRDGFLFVDGTLIPLADKPGHHGESYFDRKSNYSLNVQLITLPNLRIVDYVIGHCGSAHDSTVFMESRTFKDRESLIGHGEWIWADSAYASETWCVTPYKKPASNITENKTFNYWVSHIRIKSEHAVGYLKGRFQSLRGLRQQIKNATDHLRAIEWIRTCIIIHTFIHEIENGSGDRDWEEAIIAEANEETGRKRPENASKTLS